MFKKILIANRGEIAVRIMRSCKKMGIKTVAVYSEADTNALHVREADEAVYIGPSPSRKSYLNVDNLVDACLNTGAEAVHPGYGFLSENAEFARRLAQAGITLIGPSPESIRKMGDKIESKKIAREAGVSTVPGTLDVISTLEEALAVVKEIGYPVMIKAAAGGGGKGMRIARSEKELADGIKYAGNEATSSFNDGRVFIERFVDRECSIQRRHQKVIEEAPSSFLDEATRKKMGEQAVALAKAVGYYSAGTVEFIVDENKEFYFLEMNTRLQVEHRVTELVTGIDLVEQMIRVAAGEKLEFGQKDIQLHGWAMEARIYAEDPKRSFLPSTGRITRYEEPRNLSHVLIDTGIYEGGEVSMFYDPMVAKVCSSGETRDEAIATIREALAAFIIEGISHNGSFLEAILGHPRFAAGDINTNFIEQEYPGGFIGAELNSESTKVFLGAAVTIFLRDAERAARVSGQVPGRERAIGARWVVNVDGEDYPVYVRHDQDQGYFITHNRKLISVRTGWNLGRLLFQATVNGKPVSVQIKHLEEGYLLSYGGSDVTVKVRTPRVAELAQFMPKPQERNKKGQLVAPIAGLVVGMRVKEGQQVKAGQELVVIEAMKMENVIYAEADVTVQKIMVADRESVAVDQVLIQFAA
ncbi:MAG: acetyl/propionyl/methylcrotonyl-CoA carboxylase subunit alpha [Proteobacteria bacterium]|nr:acetyl/propionyl/methylcrotonyl-CoA carboxylase subunit alpha [Pseudomonadota bacterium]